MTTDFNGSNKYKRKKRYKWKYQKVICLLHLKYSVVVTVSFAILTLLKQNICILFQGNNQEEHLLILSSSCFTPLWSEDVIQEEADYDEDESETDRQDDYGDQKEWKRETGLFFKVE